MTKIFLTNNRFFFRILADILPCASLLILVAIFAVNASAQMMTLPNQPQRLQSNAGRDVSSNSTLTTGSASSSIPQMNGQQAGQMSSRPQSMMSSQAGGQSAQMNRPAGNNMGAIAPGGQAPRISPLPTHTIPQASPITTDSRIKTLVYNANEVYQLKFHYGYQSFIEFSNDEEIEMISIGESFAWRLTPAGRRLFIRPLEIAAHTNMTIITNRRTYQFDIRSGEYDGRADEELVYTVRFYYPEIGVPLPIPQQLAIANTPSTPTNPYLRGVIKSPSMPLRVDKKENLGLDDPRKAMNFDYSITGRANNIAPIKIFDDGKETYFQFKNNNLTIPTISAVDIFGNETPLTYIIKDDFVIVSAVELQFTLRMADSLLCVFNNKLRIK